MVLVDVGQSVERLGLSLGRNSFAELLSSLNETGKILPLVKHLSAVCSLTFCFTFRKQDGVGIKMAQEAKWCIKQRRQFKTMEQ